MLSLNSSAITASFLNMGSEIIRLATNAPNKKVYYKRNIIQSKTFQEDHA